MAIHKRKKNTRQRAHTTHGWGSMKKHRGAGNRGGRGNSGSGKRADQNKPSFWKDTKYVGKHGFKSKSRAPDTHCINIKTLEDKADNLVNKGLAEMKNGSYAINLADLGYNKLLGTGRATKKFMLKTDFATQKAIDKIQKAGGKVDVRNAHVKEAQNASKPAQDPEGERAEDQ